MPALEAISSVTLGSDQSTISIASIPQTYQHLQLRVWGRNTAVTNSRAAFIRFNDITTNSYSHHSLISQSTTGGAASTDVGASVGGINIGNLPAANAAANAVGGSIIDIYDYASTNKVKVVKFLSGFDLSAAIGAIRFGGGIFNSTAAITKIELYDPSGGSYLTNTVISLYGYRSS